MQVVRHMNEVDQNGHLDLVVRGEHGDGLDRVVVAVNDGDPGPGVRVRPHVSVGVRPDVLVCREPGGLIMDGLAGVGGEVFVFHAPAGSVDGDDLAVVQDGGLPVS